jgi:4-hydroxyphenylpyruvate dioxygenase
MAIQGKDQARPMEEEADFLQIKAWDHIEFWVGNAKQAAHFWRTGFGFQPVAYSGLETGDRQRASYVLEQGAIRLVLSTPYTPHSEMAAHHLLHGDGVHALALQVDDVESAYRETTARGATGFMAPTEIKDDHGVIRLAAIRTYGQTIHTFVDRSDYNGIFLPGYQSMADHPRLPAARATATPTGLAAIDHVVGNVELGKMNYWVNWYHQVMGFRQITHYDDKQIHTEYSALMSKVMANGNGRVKFPINEPAEGRKKSQIEEYLDYYIGPGAQHVALITGDILSTVRQLRDNGIEFLRVPDTYYQALPERIGAIDEPLDEIAELGILADRDDEGYLLQVFSKPIQDRPTVFIEVIQRHGARGFGVGNFRALFESLEREQELRGNL